MPVILHTCDDRQWSEIVESCAFDQRNCALEVPEIQVSQREPQSVEERLIHDLISSDARAIRAQAFLATIQLYLIHDDQSIHVRSKTVIDGLYLKLVLSAAGIGFQENK